MVAHQAVTDGAPIFRFSYTDMPEPASASCRAELHYVRASGIAQARLQLAVLSGNRRRALEQIDRLVEIDSLLERLARGEGEVRSECLEAELAEQKLAIASEKLALVSGIELPRLEPAFGGGMGRVLGEDEPIEIVEDETLKRRLMQFLLWGAGLLVACSLISVTVLTLI